MAKIFLDMTISLDGFVAAPGVSAEHPTGATPTALKCVRVLESPLATHLTFARVR